MVTWARTVSAAMSLCMIGFAATAVFGETGSTANGAVKASFQYTGGMWPDDIHFTDLHGHVHDLQRWRGQLILVNFWATWCAPCRKEIPNLAEAQRRFGARGFRIIGSAVDDPSTVRQEKGLLGINYPLMVGSPESMRRLMARLGDKKGTLPFSLLVAPDGRIVDRRVGAFSAGELDRLIEQNLPR